MQTIAALPISAIIPAYRAADTIERAIASVREQRRPPLEIIVVDDASGDATADTAAAAGARVVRLVCNMGPSGARNAGAVAATQPWIAFLDADDYWHEAKLEAQWGALERWPDAGMCFTDYDAVYGPEHVVRCAGSREAGYALTVAAERVGDLARFTERGLVPGLIRSMFVRQSSELVKRELFLRVGGFDPRLRLSEDQDLALRLIASAPAVAVERSLVTYVRRPGSLSADPMAEIDGTERLWRIVLNEPHRYSPLVVERAAAQRRRIVWYGARLAMRLGRFVDAAGYARRSISTERFPQAAALYLCARLLDSSTGAAAYRSLRRVKRWLAAGGYLGGAGNPALYATSSVRAADRASETT